MPGIASVSDFTAELRKISLIPGLEKKWRILAGLDSLENVRKTIFCRIALI
jgi:hypothetical protein